MERIEYTDWSYKKLRDTGMKALRRTYMYRHVVYSTYIHVHTMYELHYTYILLHLRTCNSVEGVCNSV